LFTLLALIGRRSSSYCPACGQHSHARIVAPVSTMQQRMGHPRSA